MSESSIRVSAADGARYSTARQGYASAHQRQIDILLSALLIALPYVTDAEGFPEQFKPGVVARHVKQVRAAIKAAEGVIR